MRSSITVSNNDIAWLYPGIYLFIFIFSAEYLLRKWGIEVIDNLNISIAGLLTPLTLIMSC